MALKRKKKQCHCFPYNAGYCMIAPKIMKFWKLKPYYHLLEHFKEMGHFYLHWRNVPWQYPEPMSHLLMCSQQSQSFSSRGAPLWRQMVQNQAGLFMGNVVIFIDLAIDVVRVSNLTQDHTGCWRNSWQKSLCLPAKWSFPKIIYLPQETSLLIAA